VNSPTISQAVILTGFKVACKQILKITLYLRYQLQQSMEIISEQNMYKW
jgi:hypothetical protein